jgi:hypothetical protein
MGVTAAGIGGDAAGATITVFPSIVAVTDDFTTGKEETMIRKMLLVIALSLLSGCWFHAGHGHVGGGVGKADQAPAHIG